MYKALYPFYEGRISLENKMQLILSLADLLGRIELLPRFKFTGKTVKITRFTDNT